MVQLTDNKRINSDNLLQGIKMPQDLQTNDEIESCFDVMSELRNHLNREEFLPTIRKMQTEGYQLAYILENNEIVALAGYRIYTNLFMGKHLYVDDLVTSNKYRSKGYGEEMIEWLRDKANASECNYFHLNSGTQRSRAHKFYFKPGFSIASYHFSEKLDGST